MAFKAGIVIIALTVIATEDVGGENGDTCRNQRDKYTSDMQTDIRQRTKQYWFGALPVVQHNSNLFRGLQIIEYNRRQFVFQNKCLVISSYFRI